MQNIMEHTENYGNTRKYMIHSDLYCFGVHRLVFWMCGLVFWMPGPVFWMSGLVLGMSGLIIFIIL